MPTPNANLQSKPNKHTDRIRWNESWERDLKKSNYGSSRRAISYAPGPDDSADVATSEVCQLQHELCEYVVRRITNDDFAEKWKTLPQSRREEMVLNALFEASCVEPNVENHRQWCPEMTIAYLTSNDGRGLLSLLLAMLPEDLQETIVEPIIINHAGVDQRLKNKRFRASATRHRKHRTYFISMVLFHVMLAFYEEETEYAAFVQRQSLSRIASGDGGEASGTDRAIVQEMSKLAQPQVHTVQMVHEIDTFNADQEIVRETVEKLVRPAQLQNLPTVISSNNGAGTVPQKEEETSHLSVSASSTVILVSSAEGVPQGEGNQGGSVASSHDLLKGTPHDSLQPLEQPSTKEIALKAKCEELSNQCWKCEKFATKLRPGQDLKLCGKCTAVGRSIRYCSRECQVGDWKKGTGTHCAHKWICGQLIPHDFPHQVLLTQEEVIVKVPSPDPGFKRSQALLHLISFLEQPKMVDYVFICPPDEEKLVIIPPFTGLGADRNQFLAVRQRALKYGDPASVKKMFQVLKPWAELLGYPDSKLKQQLKNEYNVDVDRVSAQPVAISPSEVAAVHKLSEATRHFT